MGPRTIARIAGTKMVARKRGRIVNIGSVVGRTGNAGQANYAAAKAALAGFSQNLAVQFACHGVTVNCILPGYTRTDVTANLTDSQKSGWLDRIPMRRYASADEMIELVLFLLGDGSAYITGQSIAFDGGLLAQAELGLTM
ncbi:MAG: hypothetical protein NVSMB52_19380 [Chloroflexota bacterium]